MMAETRPAAAFRCGPRRKGNTDRAAALFQETLAGEGLAAEAVFLRSRVVAPCAGCGACLKAPHLCPLAAGDESEALFGHLLRAPFLVFASPIYFYHVPAIFKALIDRGQRFYSAREAGDPRMLGLAPRRAYVILAAGRPRGERLFEGALLTLKYFLAPFAVTLEAPLTLRGLDGPGDFAQSEEARDMVRDYALAAARREKGNAAPPGTSAGF